MYPWDILMSSYKEEPLMERWILLASYTRTKKRQERYIATHSSLYTYILK